MISRTTCEPLRDSDAIIGKLGSTFSWAWWHMDGQQINRWWVLFPHSWRYKNTCTKDVSPPPCLWKPQELLLFSSDALTTHLSTVTRWKQNPYRNTITEANKSVVSKTFKVSFPGRAWLSPATVTTVSVFLSAMPPVFVRPTDEWALTYSKGKVERILLNVTSCRGDFAWKVQQKVYFLFYFFKHLKQTSWVNTGESAFDNGVSVQEALNDGVISNLKQAFTSIYPYF